MDHITTLPISKFINSKFREYSLYVIQSRGIPNFYDALTPVQRYILMNAPTSFQKTLSLVGNCISGGYHHSNSSLEGAIAKLTRPFGAALQILDGYGFFGSEVCPEPAAARYTSIKISSKTNEILKKYNYLTTKDEDGAFHPFWMDVPLGLTTPIIGIAVGYKSVILARKLEDIEKYFNGTIKSVKPYFMNFNGSIQKYKGLKNAWLVSSKITIDGNRIQIREIPPILKYTSALKRLDWLFNKFEGNIRILNNSNTKVNVDIIYTGKKHDDWVEIQNFCNKVFSIIVNENIVFVKDNQVIVYDSIEQYLDDYKWQLKRLAYNKSLKEKNFIQDDLEFNKAKYDFINFMLLKKRSILEIDEYCKSYVIELKEKLERLTSKKFTKDELISTEKKIKQLTIDLKEKEKELKYNKSEFNKLIDPTIKRGITSKQVTADLFSMDDIKEVDGIYIWNGEDNEIQKDEIEEDIDE